MRVKWDAAVFNGYLYTLRRGIPQLYPQGVCFVNTSDKCRKEVKYVILYSPDANLLFPPLDGLNEVLSE